MTVSVPRPEATASPSSWKETIARYRQPDRWRSIWQIVNTFVPYFLLLYLMYLSLSVSYWLTLLLAIPAAGLAVRLFIIFHDCGHGAFFKSRRANDAVGIISGLFVFTPYYQWRHHHAVHHASAGDLDRRGTGDVWTMTLREYREANRWQRLIYRVYRNPIVLFLFAPVLLFVVGHRFADPKARRRERFGVYWTNLALLGLIALASATIGFWPYALIQLPIIWLATSAGVWLFYVQHQFEGVYWERHEEWDYVRAALQGSSFYKLPRVLQWFTGNIGFHHIHHLSPRIPNYNLEPCHNADPTFQEIEPVTLWRSFKAISFRLWDEESCRLVGFSAIKDLAAVKDPA